MNITAEPDDLSLVFAALRDTVRRDIRAREADSAAQGAGLEALLEAHRSVGLELQKFFSTLSDKDIALLYAVWNAGRTGDSTTVPFPGSAKPAEPGDWRRTAIRLMSASVRLVRYLKSGARIVRCSPSVTP